MRWLHFDCLEESMSRTRKCRKIEQAAEPLAKALIMSRIGNYIDFGAFDPYIIKLIIN